MRYELSAFEYAAIKPMLPNKPRGVRRVNDRRLLIILINYGCVTDSRRDHLIDQVRHGKMTPAEAEAEAARLKLDPLEYRPKPEDFDPMKETFWPLPMAVAWIAYRTADEVREWWNAYRTECWDWHFRRWRVGFEGPVYEGHFLEQRSSATLAHLQLSATFDQVSGDGPALKMSVEEAKEAALWVALREGMVESFGVNSTTGVREKIAAHAWHDLESHEERDRDVIETPLAKPGPGLHYEQVVVWRKAITGMWPDKLPPPPTLLETMSPTGPGVMPLYCAAQWIATKGGKHMFNPNDQNIWKTAFDDLLAHISADQVRAIGVRNGEREPVPGHHFAACPVDYPFSDPSIEMMLSNSLYLCSYPYVDEKHWTSGFDDSLRDRRGERWSQLMVRKEDIARHWPFEQDHPSRSGAPGRPSSMHLIVAELDRRAQQGQLAPSLAAQARELEGWLRQTHPEHPRAGQTAIENAIRATWHQLKKPGN